MRAVKNSQIFFIQSLPIYTSCLFSMLLNKDIADMEKPDEHVFFLFRCILRMIFTCIILFYYTLKICVNNKWCLIRFLILIKFYYFSVFRRHNYITKTFIFTYVFIWFKFFCRRRIKTIQTIKISKIFWSYCS